MRKIKIRYSKLGAQKGCRDARKTGDLIVYFQIRESRKRHQGPIMDFLYTYCARVGKGTRVQLWIFYMHIVREPLIEFGTRKPVNQVRPFAEGRCVKQVLPS
jgi:hypothetical protein